MILSSTSIIINLKRHWWRRLYNHANKEIETVYQNLRLAKMSVLRPFSVEASEVAEAVEVNEAAEVLRPERSLLRTSELSRFLNSASFWCFNIYFLKILIKYHVEFSHLFPFFQFHHDLVQNNFKKKCNNINEATTKHILNMLFQTLKYLKLK